MRSFRNSSHADEDLISILAYTYEKWGIEQQGKYAKLLEGARDEIREEPFLLGSKEREDLAPGCRLYRVERHYIVYRVKDDVIEIARVLHESMDFHLQIKGTYFPEHD